ncbi:MAG: methylmalonyl-CoA decarboxylase [Aquisalimonadaceae bacterium]
MPLVLATVEDRIGFITFNHVKKRNVLSTALVDAVIATLADFKRQQVRVVILRAGPGAQVWSAGHDINEHPELHRDPLEWDAPVRRLIRAIELHSAPVVAMIEGSVWGGGCETAFACDLVVAASNATFAFTPAKIGVPYNISGMVTFMNAANLRSIKEMAFTAQPIDAQRAERLGMVNHVVANAELEAFTVNLARQIAANAPLSISVMKEELRLLASANPLPPQEFERIQALRQAVFESNDHHEGILAFREKRKPAFNGD